MAELKIDVQDLHKSYGDNEVLKGIDAKFYEGDVVCIIGPSGSGKSTFLWDGKQRPVRLDYSPDGSVAYVGYKQ